MELLISGTALAQRLLDSQTRYEHAEKIAKIEDAKWLKTRDAHVSADELVRLLGDAGLESQRAIAASLVESLEECLSDQAMESVDAETRRCTSERDIMNQVSEMLAVVGKPNVHYRHCE